MPNEESRCAVSRVGPFIDTSGEDPTVPKNYEQPGRCYGSSADGGECTAMEISFESIEDWEDHRDEYHPVQCSEDGCKILAAYTRDNAPWSSCYKHIPDELDPVYAWRRMNTNSVVEPPQADGHLIEEVLP